MIFQKELIKSLKTYGTKNAIEYSNGSISYSELLAASNKITKFLLDLQIGREAMVGIILPNRLDIVSTIIGTANARCVFVPVDATLPAERKLKMVNELDCIITSKDISGDFHDTSIYFIEDIFDGDDTGDLAYPECEEDDSLYVYFTSGSTGEPKGIVGRNCSLLQFINWEIEAFGVTSESRFSQFISPYFDAFLRDVFVPLFAGGTICIPSYEDDFFTTEKLIPWIDETEINFVHCVPSLFRVFNSDTLTADNFKNLRYILLSGERIIPSELKKWYNTFHDRIQLVNLYGATETTMIRSYYLIQSSDANQAKIPIGMPIANTDLLIANKDLKPCNVLIPGELYVVSNFITKGYLNAPELTKEKFIKLNAGTPDEVMAFKTGDKARKLANGQIDLLGREDRMIKLRGIRIELDEIELLLGRSELVKQAVVINHADESGAESLIAFIIKSANSASAENIDEKLRDHLKNLVSEYMIPSAFILLDEYPLLSNGKIDYKALAKYVLEANTIVAPVDEFESKVLDIWKEILGDKPISTEDSFHKIGGNSLSIMKLIGRIYKEFNVRISLSQLFNNLTVKQQASFIKLANKDYLYEIHKAEEKVAYNLSSSQERMYYNQELKKSSTSYNLPMVAEIKGDFDKDKIETTLRTLVERHEALRTHFTVDDGKLLQIVDDSACIELEEVEGKSDDPARDIEKFIRPFDLNKAPLLRSGLITTTDDRKLLVVDFHHIICDGMSQMTLLSDFSRVYSGLVLEPLNIQYKDYAEWEYNFKLTEEYIAHREFWLQSFEGEIPKLELPIMTKPEEDATDSGGKAVFEIEKEVLSELDSYLEQEDLTISSGLFTLYYLFLAQLSGQEDIVIGVASSGRMQQELEDVVGMFVKTLPVRYKIDPDMSVKDLLKDINKRLIEANSKQVYDLTNIVIELNKYRSEPVKSLFDAVFVFQNFEEKTMGETEGQFSIYPFENTSSKYPLTLYVNQTDLKYGFKIEYLSSYFTKADVELLCDQFIALVNKASHNLDSKIVDVLGGDAATSGFVEDDISFNF